MTSAASGHGVAMQWADTQPTSSERYLAPTVIRWLREGPTARVLDLGCGNGAFTCRLAAEGFAVTGIDASASGIRAATARAVPGATFRQAWLETALTADLVGAYDAVVAIEVVEHMARPAELCRRATEALRPGGRFVLTTPYHGYVKNIAIALVNGFDRHWHPLTDGGHIKFFSRATITALLHDNGFRVRRFSRAGRIPLLAKSMIIEAERR